MQNQLKTGMPPGTLIYVGKKAVHNPEFSLLWYNVDNIEEKNNCNIKEISHYLKRDGVLWLNLDGVHNSEQIAAVGQEFGIHNMLLEDIMHTGQRPKMEENNDYLFISMNMISLQPSNKALKVEQISFILGENYILSFQELPEDVFDMVRERLRKGRGKIRARNADYLLYALMDVIVDHYFICSDYFGSQLEILDDQIEKNLNNEVRTELKRIKNTLMKMRRSVLPLRDIAKILQGDDNEWVDKNIQRYYKDVYDHTLSVFESIESNILISVELKDAYITGLTLRANKVMQVLTIIATIFIPLTFIAGLYGMNFDNMPELHHPYGYFILLSIMTVLAVSLLFIFRKNKWL